MVKIIPPRQPLPTAVIDPGKPMLNKGTNLSRITQQQCDRIAEQLNNRPRLRLGFMTPNEAYY